MKRTTLITEIKKIFSHCVATAAVKNKDYAVDEDAFANFRLSNIVGVAPERAILVRITDKIARVSRLLDKQPDVVNEKVEDTIRDAINYLAILDVYLKEGK